ncbi:MAG TPA: bifunctional UDP-N-acetylglucosamine diphosphorylase/glucosamine-1-phosphate N-acetyltransferase GlmU [Nevskiales bacterium]|nr:bifunctional UDP-N-acetylglucosamine diphosphorylase/glucosamine-1-phosphate N-acetyltransferase GlmU [Nevskiales bacterium]
MILAAGQGTRMRSSLPKVLHAVGGKPMLGHVLDTAQALEAAAVHVVHGHGAEQVRECFEGRELRWVLQAQQLGTAHALQQAMPDIPDEATVLVLYGDVPLVRAEILQPAVAAGARALALVTAVLADPKGYGRILRDRKGGVRGIVEENDASPAQKKLREINTGFLAAPAGRLRGWLQKVKNDNVKREYYLTDVVALAVKDRVRIVTVAADEQDILGVNDRAQLAQVERLFQQRQAECLLRAGLALRDPARFDLRGELVFGRDAAIDVNVLLEGRVVLGEGVRIGAGCVLRDCEIGDGSEVLPYSVLQGAKIGAGCQVGPFARLRPGTVLAEGARVGNFVETKNARLGAGSKANHLSYVGDAEVGRDVNIGAGTITCNYDGANKHKTVIEDGAFIGSNTALVAPVTVGADATIGAGSTVTRNAPAGQLTVTRAKQVSIEGWRRPRKK